MLDAPLLWPTYYRLKKDTFFREQNILLPLDR